MGISDYKDLGRKTTCDRVLYDKSLEIAVIPK